MTGKRSKRAAGALPRQPWRVHFFRRHPADDPAQAVPARNSSAGSREHPDLNRGLRLSVRGSGVDLGELDSQTNGSSETDDRLQRWVRPPGGEEPPDRLLGSACTARKISLARLRASSSWRMRLSTASISARASLHAEANSRSPIRVWTYLSKPAFARVMSVTYTLRPQMVIVRLSNRLKLLANPSLQAGSLRHFFNLAFSRVAAQQPSALRR